MRGRLPHACRITIATLALVVGWRAHPAAQEATLTLRQAVERALAGYPGVAAAEAERDAAAATIDIARQAYRPRVDGLVQLNRATHSNVAGVLLPQGVIAPISGPVASDNSDGSVWGTAIGALVSWKPFDFGARHASVRAAEQGDEVTRLSLERVRLETASAAADAYLSVLAADATATAAQAAVDRAGVLVRTVQALVDAGLRPGVDAASVNAEHAAATMLTIQARRASDAARALLAQYAGAPARTVVLPPPPIPVENVDAEAADNSLAKNPAIRERQAAIDEAAIHLDLARRSADPDVAVQGTLYGRGTGVLANNASGPGADGLGLDESNWAVGVTVTVPMMEWSNRHAREAVQAARLKATSARRDEALRDLARRRDVALRDRRAAADLMKQAPLVVAAARDAVSQATARYQAGLASITDVADAQRRLAQAEMDLALVELAGWRAEIGLSAATAERAEDFLDRLPPQP